MSIPKTSLYSTHGPNYQFNFDQTTPYIPHSGRSVALASQDGSPLESLDANQYLSRSNLNTVSHQTISSDCFPNIGKIIRFGKLDKQGNIAPVSLSKCLDGTVQLHHPRRKNFDDHPNPSFVLEIKLLDRPAWTKNLLENYSVVFPNGVTKKILAYLIAEAFSAYVQQFPINESDSNPDFDLCRLHIAYVTEWVDGVWRFGEGLVIFNPEWDTN